MNVSILLTALLLGCVSTLAAKPSSISEFTKVEFENQSPATIVMFNFNISRTSKVNSVLYIEFELSEDVSQATGLILLQLEHSGKYFNYTTLEVDYCKVLQTVHSQYIVQMIAVELRHKSNLPFDCPFKKNVRYTIRGFQVGPKGLPSYLPRLSFKFDMTFLTNKRQLLHLIAHGRVGRM